MKDINLLPEDIKSTTSYSPSKPGSGISLKVITILILIALFIGATLVAPSVYIKTLEANLSAIEKAIEDPKFDEVKKVRADTSAVKAIIDSKSDVMATVDKNIYPINEILIAVNSSIPKGTSLNRIEYKNNQVTLTGFTEDILAIAELVTKIDRLDSVNIASDITVNETNKFTLKLNVGGKEGK
ncbi:MAG: PilN domain-containing protein [Clostridiaceae bacterium]|jgi:Tfp pilus assembly protein PilN|nr:PilN domain-containing protein [Clostridiaceae bacterium]